MLPCRTAAAQAIEREGIVVPEPRPRADLAEWHGRGHLVRAPDDRQPVAGVKVAVPLADRWTLERVVEALHLEGVEQARVDVRGDLGHRQGEVGADREPAHGSAAPQPVGHQMRDGRAQRTFGGSSAAEGQHRDGRTDEPDMAEQVLPVLAPDPDRMRTVGRDEVGAEVGDARVVVAPLGREQVDDVHVFGARLEKRRRRREEMDVRVPRHPAPTVGSHRLAEPHDDSRAGLVGIEVQDDWSYVRSRHDLEDRAVGRDGDLERRGDVGIGSTVEDDVRTEVLVERRIHLVAVSQRREVATVTRDDADARGRWMTVGRLDADPDEPVRWRERLTRASGCTRASVARAGPIANGTRSSPISRTASVAAAHLKDLQDGLGVPERGVRRRQLRPAVHAHGPPAADRSRRLRPRQGHPARDDPHIDGRSMVGRSAKQERLAREPAQWRSRAPERRHGREDDPAARPVAVARLELDVDQGARPAVGSADIDRMQPEHEVIGPARHVVA